MVKDAYLSMKLSNYCKSKELLSTQDSVLWCYKEPILTSGGGGGGGGGKLNKYTQTPRSFAHFHTGCSLLLITALNSSVNKTR